MIMIDLEKNKINSGFNVPNNYFDNLDKTILSKIQHQYNDKNNNILQRTIIYTISIAASLLFIFNITSYNNASYKNNDYYDEDYILNDDFIIDESINIDIANNDNKISNFEIEEFILNDDDIYTINQ